MSPTRRWSASTFPSGCQREGRRQADVAARELLGPRRASVFFTPVREALLAPTHPEVSAIAKQLTGHGISQQAYARSVLRILKP